MAPKNGVSNTTTVNHHAGLPQYVGHSWEVSPPAPPVYVPADVNMIAKSLVKDIVPSGPLSSTVQQQIAASIGGLPKAIVDIHKAVYANYLEEHASFVAYMDGLKSQRHAQAVIMRDIKKKSHYVPEWETRGASLDGSSGDAVSSILQQANKSVVLKPKVKVTPPPPVSEYTAPKAALKAEKRKLKAAKILAATTRVTSTASLVGVKAATDSQYKEKVASVRAASTDVAATGVAATALARVEARQEKVNAKRAQLYNRAGGVPVRFSKVQGTFLAPAPDVVRSRVKVEDRSDDKVRVTRTWAEVATPPDV